MSEIRLLTERMTALINKWVPQMFEANSELEMKDWEGYCHFSEYFWEMTPWEMRFWNNIRTWLYEFDWNSCEGMSKLKEDQ